MKRWLILISILVICGCTPLGYLQSPRVTSGFSVSEIAGVTIPLQETAIVAHGFMDSTLNRDSVYHGEVSNFGLRIAATHFQWGIADRVRLSANLGGFPLVFLHAGGECMIHLFSTGEPALFRNISVGVVGSAGRGVWGTGDFNYTVWERELGGVLLGTYHAFADSNKQCQPNELEFVLGLGISRHKNETTRSPTPENGIGFTDLYYTTDFAPSVQFHIPSKKLIFALGVTVSPIIFHDSWIGYTFGTNENTSVSLVNQQSTIPFEVNASFTFSKLNTFRKPSKNFLWLNRIRSHLRTKGDL